LLALPAECYCDNSISVSTPSTQCTMGELTPLTALPERTCDWSAGLRLVACSGDSTQICGGPQALIILKATAADQTSQTLANGWTAAKTCLIDGQNGRLFDGASTSSSTMTQEVCTDFCASKGFDQAGLEYSTGASRLTFTRCYCLLPWRWPLPSSCPPAPAECFCSSSSTVNIATAAKSSSCNMPCGGNQQQLCGGGDALWVFTKSN
jgi:hypothetical protein